MTTYHASWLLTDEDQPIRDGVLQVEAGRVAYAGPRRGEIIDVELGDALIVPGFVNTHTHLDLGGLKLPQPHSFTEWLWQVVQYRRSSTVAEWQDAITAGIAESRRHGTTALGDISCGGWSWLSLEESGLRFVHFFELIGLGDDRADEALAGFTRWRDELANAEETRRGVSPHAPYSVARGLMNRLVDAHSSGEKSYPVAMHVAETREELELLRDRTGPFEAFLHRVGGWNPGNLFGSVEEVIYLLNRFDSAVLVHGNYLLRPQWERLSRDVSVVYCPRTHHYFCHDEHPYLDMLTDGVNVALGTDSLASNPDLSILNECRFLWSRDRGRLDPTTLLRMATLNGQRALRTSHSGELLSHGTAADFVVVPCRPGETEPWEALFAGDSLPVSTFVGGTQVYL